MSVIVRMLTALMTMTLGTAEAIAQPQVTVVHCDPLVGATLGGALNGDNNAGRTEYADNPGHGAVDLAASLEQPISDRWGVRLDVGTAAWTFQSRDPWGAPLVRDRVHLGRATLSFLKVVGCGSPVRRWLGLGIGAYRYQFGDDALNLTRGGLHGFLGFDVAISERGVITTDIAMHAVRGPDRPPVDSYFLNVLRVSVGARIRF